MDLGLRGKSAAVLGASEGIGRAVAEKLAAEGADLVLAARREQPLRETAAELAKRHGVKAHPVVCDVRELRDLERVFDAVEMEAGRLDVLVVNHGGPPSARLADATDAMWHDAFELILLSAVRALRLARPLLERRGGSVVHVVSTAAKEPIDGLTLSNALRPAVLGLAKSASRELAPLGVRVNCVLPGMTDTERLRAVDAARAAESGVGIEEVRERRMTAIPLGRIGRAEDVANAVAFLGSDAARYVTGQVWAVDGGLLRGVY